jgi:hypothetical protein
MVFFDGSASTESPETRWGLSTGTKLRLFATGSTQGDFEFVVTLPVRIRLVVLLCPGLVQRFKAQVPATTCSGVIRVDNFVQEFVGLSFKRTCRPAENSLWDLKPN